MHRYIVGNWKMQGDAPLVRRMIPAIASFAAAQSTDAEIVVCPPFPWLSLTAETMQGSFLQLGAQDVSAHQAGAYTGEVSAAMLKEIGCRYVIIGHSERRQYHAESPALIRRKMVQALDNGLIPILCVGETLEERDTGSARAVVQAQLEESLPDPATSGHFLLAYEPVWAIGSGRTPTGAQIAEMHAHICQHTQGRIPVLYGGSVKADNARDLFQIPDVSGVLVGGASLKVDEFCGIIAASER